MRKIKRFLLVDECDKTFTDVITFDDLVNIEDVVNIIDKVKEDKAGEYTNEDIYNALGELNVGFTIDFVGSLDVIYY